MQHPELGSHFVLENGLDTRPLLACSFFLMPALAFPETDTSVAAAGWLETEGEREQCGLAEAAAVTTSLS